MTQMHLGPYLAKFNTEDGATQEVPFLSERGLVKSGGNIATKFREAFESWPVPAKWNSFQDTGDLVFVDGNTGSASYLVISKSPWNSGTESWVETVQKFKMPVEVSFGLHMSQRQNGQDVSVELVDIADELPVVADLPISAISQSLTVLSIDFDSPHGLVPGKCIGVYGCSDVRVNFPSLVVATIPSPTQITCTAGPAGTITSQVITNPAGAKGFVYFRERFGRARNGVSQIFENATVTNSSLYVRSDTGDALVSGTLNGNQSVTIGSTASVPLLASTPYSYCFAPTTEFRIVAQTDRVQWTDVAIDAVTQSTARLTRTQVCPSSESSYKFRVRACNNKALTVLRAAIVSATKSGTTTATVVTDRPHGLATGDVIQTYGTRDQTNFANITLPTAVASIVNPTTFTIVWGSAVTATTYGGIIARVNGGNLLGGPSSIVVSTVQLVTLGDGTRQLNVVGNSTWTATIGNLIELAGCRDNVSGADLLLDGPWKVANVSGTTLTLVLPFSGQRSLPADFGVTNAGGAVIVRTCTRLSWVRIFDFERTRIEALARPTSDIAGSMPVSVQNTVATTSSSTSVAGTVAVDAAIGNPVTAGLRASNANIAAMSAAGDSVGWMGTMIGAGIVRPFSIPEADWITPSPVGGLLNTATPFQVREAGAAGIRNYITAIDLQSEALTNATDFRIREPDVSCSSQTIASNILVTAAAHNLSIGDAVVFTASTVTGISAGVTYFVLTVPTTTQVTLSATRGGSTLAISGTGVTATFHRVLWMMRIPTVGITPRSLVFPTPLRGSPATALQIQTATASGAGAVYANLQGYTAP
jgi:hypothetical protein